MNTELISDRQYATWHVFPIANTRLDILIPARHHDTTIVVLSCRDQNAKSFVAERQPAYHLS